MKFTIFTNSPISWKGKTFQQISNCIKYNHRGPNLQTNNVSYFHPLPLNLYRNTIDGAKTTITEIYQPNLSCLSEESCSSITSASQNALRRVRSSGMVSKNSATRPYFTSNQQYIQNRNRSFGNNQKFHAQEDSFGQTIFASNTLNSCQKYTFLADATFQYIWVFDETSYTVLIPAGSYTLEDFNRVFHQVMLFNKHYYIEKSTNTKMFLMDFSYNETTKHVQFQSL